MPLGTAANFTSNNHLAAPAIEYDVRLSSTYTELLRRIAAVAEKYSTQAV